jgi:hypothetical protein
VEPTTVVRVLSRHGDTRQTVDRGGSTSTQSTVYILQYRINGRLVMYTSLVRVCNAVSGVGIDLKTTASIRCRVRTKPPYSLLKTLDGNALIKLCLFPVPLLGHQSRPRPRHRLSGIVLGTMCLQKASAPSEALALLNRSCAHGEDDCHEAHCHHRHRTVCREQVGQHVIGGGGLYNRQHAVCG